MNKMLKNARTLGPYICQGTWEVFLFEHKEPGKFYGSMFREGVLSYFYLYVCIKICFMLYIQYMCTSPHTCLSIGQHQVRRFGSCSFKVYKLLKIHNSELCLVMLCFGTELPYLMWYVENWHYLCSPCYILYIQYMCMSPYTCLSVRRVQVGQFWRWSGLQASQNPWFPACVWTCFAYDVNFFIQCGILVKWHDSYSPCDKIYVNVSSFNFSNFLSCLWYVGYGEGKGKGE